jgi:integrase
MTARVEKRGSSFSTRISVTDAVTGRRRQVRITKSTRREVEREARRVQHDADLGVLADPGRLTMAEYVTERWLPHAATRVRPRTMLRYTGLMHTHVLPAIGNVPLGKLRPAHVQTVVDHVLAAGRAPRTALHAYRVLSSALRQAMRWQLLATNPAAAVEPPRAERPVLVVPDADLVTKIIHRSIGTSLEMPIKLAAWTGMRLGELLALRWSDVDLDGRRFRVTNTLQWAGAGFSFAEPKTARGRRTVSLPPIAGEALRAHRRQQAERRLLAGESWHDLDLILDRGDGFPMRTEAVSAAFSKLIKRGGFPHVRFHDLRHSFATEMLKANTPPKITSEALGHSSVAFTMDVYSHVLPTMGDVAAEAIQKAYERAFSQAE